jgi:hypothetical protein
LAAASCSAEAAGREQDVRGLASSRVSLRFGVTIGGESRACRWRVTPTALRTAAALRALLAQRSYEQRAGVIEMSFEERGALGAATVGEQPEDLSLLAGDRRAHGGAIDDRQC